MGNEYMYINCTCDLIILLSAEIVSSFLVKDLVDSRICLHCYTHKLIHME